MSFANPNEAIQAISNVGATQSEIIAFVRQLSVDTPGSKTVLYSGDISGTAAYEVVKQFIGDNDVRIIDKTLAAEVLRSDAFKAKVAQAFGLSIDEFQAELNNKYSTHPAKLWLSKGGGGPWAVASEMFVEATTGPVKILTESPLADSVFVKNELPKLVTRLESGAISEIAGTTRATLLELASGGNLADDILRAAKVETILGKPAIGDAEAFMKLSEKTLGERFKLAVPSDVGRIQQVLLDHPFGGVVKRLPLLGQGLAILGGLFTAAQAGQAYAEGRPDEALHIIQDSGAELAGSTFGIAAGEVLATIGLLVGGVAVASPVGMATILIATVAGGYFGGELGVELMHLFQDHTEAQKRDIAQRMLKLVFGADYGLQSVVPTELTSGSLTLDATFSREEMVAAAQGNIAWRYALRELNPFVIAGDSLYAKHNGDGAAWVLIGANDNYWANAA